MTMVYFSLNLRWHLKKFNEFLYEAFSVEELLQFLEESNELGTFPRSLPQAVSHNKLVRELVAFAGRRNLVHALLAQLRAARPESYANYAPYLEEAHFEINISHKFMASEKQRDRAEQMRPGETFEQQVLQLVEEARQRQHLDLVLEKVGASYKCDEPMAAKVAPPDTSLFARLKSLGRPEEKREMIYSVKVKLVARGPDEALMALKEVASDGELQQAIHQLADLSIAQKL